MKAARRNANCHLYTTFIGVKEHIPQALTKETRLALHGEDVIIAA